MQIFDELRDWTAKAREAAMQGGVVLEFSQIDDPHEGECAWVGFRADQAIGQLTVWKSGKCEFIGNGLDGEAMLRERRTLGHPAEVRAEAESRLRWVGEYIADAAALGAVAARRQRELQAADADQALILILRPGAGFDLPAAEERLAAVAANIGAEYDGNDVAIDGSEVRLYLYGRDADALYGAVRPVVDELPLAPHSLAIKRYGSANDADAPEDRIALS